VNFFWFFLRLVNDQEVEEAEELTTLQQQKRADVLRRKVLTMSRMLNTLKELRTQREMQVAMSGLTLSSGQLPETAKGKLTDEIRQHLSTFSGTKAVDAVNEARPAGIERAFQKFVSSNSSSDHLRREASKNAIIAKRKGSRPNSPRDTRKDDDVVPTITTQ